MNRQSHRARKFGSLVGAQELEAGAAAGVEEGIQFRFDRIQNPPTRSRPTDSSGSRGEKACRMHSGRATVLTSSMRRVSERLMC